MQLSTLDVVKTLIDTAREAVLVVDEDLRIQAHNVAAATHFGRTCVAISGRRLAEIIRAPTLHDGFRKALLTGEEAALKLELIGPDARHFEVQIAAFELEGERGAIGFFHDVTQVDRLERVRQEFLSNISHELRTPLTSIIAFVETLEDGAIDDKEDARRFLGVIRRNAERMHLLISDILELSLIESGKISLNTTQVSLARMVEEIFVSLRSKALDRQVTLIHDIAPDFRVRADLARLDQMLTNLLDNAIKFNREGGEVRVAASANGSNSVISVEDTGEGIRAEQLERIFERFYRVDRGRDRQIGGTGLGLAIVKHLARLHGGEISAASELGICTRFTVQLPR